MLIYPENYTAPEAVSKVELSTAQRSALKTKMQEYINNKGVPIPLKELIDTAVDYLLTTHNLHIHDRVIKEIALEIQSDWFPEPEVIEEITE